MDILQSRDENQERPNSAAGSHKATESQGGHPEMSGDGHNDTEKTSTESDSPQFKPSIEIPTATNDFKPEADLEKTPRAPRDDSEQTKFRGEEEDPAVSVSFKRPTSPPTLQKSKNAAFETLGEEGINRMHKYSLYETSTRFYLVGEDLMGMHYRVLKIDRTAPPGHLSISEGNIAYNKRQINELLRTIDDGNKSTGGMKLKRSTWGLLGFIRFTEAYYMLLITKRLQVAVIGGHYIYRVDGTEMVPLTTGSTSRFQRDRSPDEARFLNTLSNLDLTKCFYFSPSYNITRSLQQNIVRERQALNEGLAKAEPDFQDVFAWNNYLLEPAREHLNNVYDWCHPIIHGFIDQSALDVYGRKVYITIIARRSRLFAGARFLKRGVNDEGFVANDVETEQIVSDVLSTSFHAPGPRLYASPSYTSFVQHRGSIPLYWTQDNSGVSPKPDIDLNFIDPFYSAAALHFDHLFERYGAPVYVLNLVKARERTPRESKLLYEYKNAIDYLNQSLPEDGKILYEAFDMARASKTRGQDVIGTLEDIAEKVLKTTNFFHNGSADDEFGVPQVQNGVARTNCIDCLDRTNAAQFVVGKRALGRQLQALGVITGNIVEYDSDCVETFTRMFHDHGDQIAVQYAGSQLVNTMATYRKLNHWHNSSRDLVENFKRYYHNSFLDSQRQEAYNLFLGNYTFVPDEPMIWDLATDYYLHHDHPRLYMYKSRRDYINWYTPKYLEPRSLPTPTNSEQGLMELAPTTVMQHDDYWLEYYRPLALSSFLKIFAYRLNEKSIPRHLSERSIPIRPQDLSPFIPRKKYNDPDSFDKSSKKPIRKGVTIIDPSSETESRPGSIFDKRHSAPHLTIPEASSPLRHSILREPHFETYYSSPDPTSLTNLTSSDFISSMSRTLNPPDRSQMSQWTLGQFYQSSLNPSVSYAEEDEYARYIEHPLNMPLVGSETPSADDHGALEFYEYLRMSENGTQYTPQDSDAAFLRPALADRNSTRYLDGETLDTHSGFSRLTSAAGFSTSTPFSHHPSHPLQLDFIPQVTNIPGTKFQVSEEDIEEFEEFLNVQDNPLDVLEEDLGRKRYKAYRQWLKGRSFFKQSKVDPEWQNQLPMR
jgi:hypothetical protein